MNENILRTTKNETEPKWKSVRKNIFACLFSVHNK